MQIVDANCREISDEFDPQNLDAVSSSTSDYFIPSFNIEILFEGKTPTGLWFHRRLDNYQSASILCPELFKESYREFECSICRQTLLSDQFEWKVKGFEGPFSSVWGKRHTQCKYCRKQYKAKLYKKKKNLIKQLEKFQVTHIGQPDPVAFLSPFSILLEDA
jgi:hypothetical protein